MSAVMVARCGPLDADAAAPRRAKSPQPFTGDRHWGETHLMAAPVPTSRPDVSLWGVLHAISAPAGRDLTTWRSANAAP